MPLAAEGTDALGQPLRLTARFRQHLVVAVVKIVARRGYHLFFQRFAAAQAYLFTDALFGAGPGLRHGPIAGVVTGGGEVFGAFHKAAIEALIGPHAPGGAGDGRGLHPVELVIAGGGHHLILTGAAEGALPVADHGFFTVPAVGINPLAVDVRALGQDFGFQRFAAFAVDPEGVRRFEFDGVGAFKGKPGIDVINARFARKSLLFTVRSGEKAYAAGLFVVAPDGLALGKRPRPRACQTAGRSCTAPTAASRLQGGSRSRSTCIRTG